MTLRLTALLVALFGLLQAGAARACSLDPAFIPPSSFELVQRADAIVIATPDSASPRDNLTFRIERVISGTPPSEFSAPLFGSLYTAEPGSYAARRGRRLQPLSGTCGTAAARGGRYLAFLVRDSDGSWWPQGEPFFRLDPEPSGDDAIWLRTVRRYRSLQQRLAPMAQIEALRAMLASGRGLEGEHLTAAERTDIADHLSSISPWKPTPLLVDAYERAARGEAVAMRLHPRGGAAGEDPPLDSRKTRIALLSALALGRHPEAMPLFERLAARPDIEPGALGPTIRYLAANGRFTRAYELVEARLLPHLMRLEWRDAWPLLRDVGDAMRGEAAGGEDLDESRAPWRRDPHAAATWPELALAIALYRLRGHGGGDTVGFSAAIRSLPHSDWRARPELSIALAADLDPEAEAWALAELARLPVTPARPADEEAEDPALLPLRMLASNWSPNRDDQLTPIFCQGGSRRRLIFLALGELGEGLYMQTLESFAGFPGLTEAERSAALWAAVKISSRQVSPGANGILSDSRERWLVSRLARGEAPALPPVTCPA